MTQIKGTKHRQPIDYTPSSFVLNCLSHKSFYSDCSDMLALDLACGYGRHTSILKSQGFSVVSGDLSIDGLQIIKRDFEPSYCVCLDASADLPFRDHSFNLVLIVHYVDKGLLSRITRLVPLGGFLVYETYGGQGENWCSLPIHGELEEELAPSFSIIKRKETYVGSKDSQHVSLKLFAKKIYA
jgi:SAM-dependent methyltransferase